MAVVQGFTTSNVAKVASKKLVMQILDSFYCPDLSLSQGGLSCSIEEWRPPIALNRAKRRLPNDENSIDFFVALELVLDEYGDSDFVALLRSLAPHLQQVFVIQAVRFVPHEFPIYAREWAVSPGDTKVEVNQMRYWNWPSNRREQIVDRRQRKKGRLRETNQEC